MYFIVNYDVFYRRAIYRDRLEIDAGVSPHNTLLERRHGRGILRQKRGLANETP